MSSDERLLLPVELRKRVSWAAPAQSLPLLASTQSNGAIIISPLADRSEELASIRAILGTAPAASRAALTFAAMALYARISLQPDGRLRLSPQLARYLSRHDNEPVWVSAHEDQVWLWPDDAWAKALTSGADELRQALSLLASASVAVGEG